MRLRAPSAVVWSVLIGGLGLGVSLLLAYLLSSIQALTEANRSSLQSQEIISQTNKLALEITEADGDVRAFLLDRDWFYLNPYADVKRDIPSDIDKLVAAVQDRPEQQKAVDNLAQAIQKKMRSLDLLISTHEPKSQESPRADIDKSVGEQSVSEIRTDAEAIVSYEEGLLDRRKSAANVERRNFTRELELSIVTMAVLLLAGFYVGYRVNGQQRRFRGLIESMGDGFYSLDYGWRVVDINQAALEMLDRSREHLAGRSIFEVFPEKLGTQIEQNFRAAMRYRKAQVFGAESPSTGRHFEYRVFPFDEGVSVFMHDITARLRAAEEIRALNETLEQRVLDRTAQLEGFCYSIAHDMRMHIRGVSVNASLLAEDIDTNGGNSQEYVKRLRQATKQMARLVEDLLTFARNSAQTVTKSQVDLSAQASEIVDRLKADADYAKDAQFKIWPGLLDTADPQLAGVVLFNLLDNACKYHRKNVRPAVEFGHTNGGGKEVFFVKDNGIGFEAQYADRIFKPFERLHSDRAIVGSGIGLANVKRIIERHGGRIWAESVLGRGSTFYFTFS